MAMSEGVIMTSSENISSAEYLFQEMFISDAVARVNVSHVTPLKKMSDAVARANASHVTPLKKMSFANAVARVNVSHVTPLKKMSFADAVARANASHVTPLKKISFADAVVARANASHVTPLKKISFADAVVRLYASHVTPLKEMFIPDAVASVNLSHVTPLKEMFIPDAVASVNLSHVTPLKLVFPDPPSFRRMVEEIGAFLKGLERMLADIIKNISENCKLLEPLKGSCSLPALFARLYAIVVSAVVLLYFVYLYLVGYVDRGGSSGSLEFRDTYISIILFQGSYVWIKSREVAPQGVYRRAILDKQGKIKYKYEPRFKPPRDRHLGSGRPEILNWIYLGQYDTLPEAKILYKIAAFYYGKGKGRLDLGSGGFFTIPAMSEEDQILCGRAKVKRVKVQAKRVYEDFKRAKLAASNLPPTSPGPDDDLNREIWEGCVNDERNQFNLTASPLQQPFPANQTLNIGMDIALRGECAELAPNTGNGSNFNTSNQMGLLQTLVNNQQQLIALQAQQLEESKIQISHMQHQILELHQQQRLHQQELQESKLQILQLQHQNLELQPQQHLQAPVQDFNVESLLLDWA